MIRWYMRVVLMFHPMETTVSHYTRNGRGLKLTLKFKKAFNKQYVYSEEDEFYNLKGSIAKRARRREIVKHK